MDIKGLRNFEARLWEAADDLRANSKLTSQQYCMPVLGLIFLRYADSRFRLVTEELQKNRPSRHGRVLPISKSEYMAKSALYLPEEARYSYLVDLPENVAALQLSDGKGHTLNSIGAVVNHAMELIEQESENLSGVLPREYTEFPDALLRELIRNFNDPLLDDVDGDVIGRIYEYFLNKFAKSVASDDGVFFTPKSLVKMIVNVIEPERGVLLDPACGSGGMFVQTGDFVNQKGFSANQKMTFYGQEKVDYNAKLCLMNMAVHGLHGNIKSGNDANTFYHDAHNLAGKCDYLMANPPFNVDKVNAENATNAGRLPFGIPGINKQKEFGNANYLWISYFYAYLNEHGRAGFVMASSATSSRGKDVNIRENLIKTGHVDVMMSVATNFFYTKSLPCTLWFFNKGKAANLLDKVLFIDARNYYTVVDRTLNEWSYWQLKNLTAIVWLYRGEVEEYKSLLAEYHQAVSAGLIAIQDSLKTFLPYAVDNQEILQTAMESIKAKASDLSTIVDDGALSPVLDELNQEAERAHQSVLDTLKNLKGKAKTEQLDKWHVPTGRSRESGYKKAGAAALGQLQSDIAAVTDTLHEGKWLTDKFGDGIYADIPGLCYVATQDEILQKDASLTPGAYVGVPEQEDDGVDFAERMKEIHAELGKLQTESNELMEAIIQDFKGISI